MVEYIERENAYALISEQVEKETGMYSKGKNNGLHIAKSIIHSKEQCPTVDVVKVVRCKNCTYANEDGTICRFGVGRGVKPEHFCGYGELKESEVEGE